MTQDVVRVSFSVQMEGASYPLGCVTETTTAETTRMNRTVVARVRRQVYALYMIVQRRRTKL